jgi:hypothetical protein
VLRTTDAFTDVHILGGFELQEPFMEGWPHQMSRLSVVRPFYGIMGVFPPTLTHLYWDHFNVVELLQLMQGAINLKSVEFGPNFYASGRLSTLLMSLWPQSVTHLKFGKYLDVPITRDDWPPRLEELVLGDAWNQRLVGLPTTLRSLTLGRNFNHHLLVGNLPHGLRRLVFGDHFNNPVLHIPDTVEYLEFGFRFNVKLPRLPANVKHVVLPAMYPQQWVEHWETEEGVHIEWR